MLTFFFVSEPVIFNNTYLLGKRIRPRVRTRLKDKKDTPLKIYAFISRVVNVEIYFYVKK